MTDIMIMQGNHPQVFAALQALDGFCGRINRLEDAVTSYQIPEPWAHRLPTLEAQCARLSPEEMDTLCDGAEDEAQAVVLRHNAQLLHAFLDDYFSGWQEERNHT